VQARGAAAAWRGGWRKACLPRIPRLPDSQKRCPTAFQLFPNAREVVLVASDWETRTIRRVEVAGVFRPPSAPGDAAAARAALAGVTRLEVLGDCNERAQLAAALAHLPGLRAASLVCGVEVQPLEAPPGEAPPGEAPPLEADELGADDLSDAFGELGHFGHFVDECDDLGVDLVAVLAGCPSIESLEWEVEGKASTGALGLRGRGASGALMDFGRGIQGQLLVAPTVLGRSALVLWKLCGGATGLRRACTCSRPRPLAYGQLPPGLPPITAALLTHPSLPPPRCKQDFFAAV
jgi:hypothetical protein